jgi:hypothetical protein
MRQREFFLTLTLVWALAGLCAAQETQQASNLDQAITGSALPKGQDAGMDERLSKMEQILQKQNEEIDTLRKQLSLKDEDRLNKARSEEIRQMVKEILADEEFRNQVYQPTLEAGYDHGFYIKSTDDSFYMKTRLMSQFRYMGVDRGSRNKNLVGNVKQDDINGFQFGRLRLYFTGWLWSKDLKYNLILEAATTNEKDNVTLKYGYFDYQYADGHWVRWGNFLLPFGKQNIHPSSFRQMFIESAMSTCVFTPGDSLGVEGYGDIIKDKLSYEVGIFNGAGDGDDTVFQSDSTFATAGRLVYHVLPGYDESDETDLMFHEKPAMDVGASFLYNDNSGDTSGQSLVYAVSDLIRAGRGGYGTSNSRGTDVLQLGLDFGFKYRGFSLGGEYYYRKVDSDHSWSQWNALTAGGIGTSDVQGGYLQAGYFIIPKKLDINARIGGVWGMGDDQSWEEAIGMNYYIKGHALKISADITHVEECPISSSTAGYTRNDDIWMYRLQIQACMD